MAIQKPTSNKPYLWGLGCLGGCFTLIVSVCGFYMWALGSALHSDEPGALSATLPLSAEEKEARAKEEAQHEELIRQNFKLHRREFDTLAKQFLAIAIRSRPTQATLEYTSVLLKLQIKDATASNKAGQWQAEFIINPKNNLGYSEEYYTYCEELYVYSKSEPAELAANIWIYHFRLADNWYFVLRNKSNN